MMIIISPSKTLNFSAHSFSTHTQPKQLQQTQVLIDTLKQFNSKNLMNLMNISEKLSVLNRQRYQNFQQPFTLGNAKQALLAFKGDVFKGIDVDNYSAEDFAFAQDHLRILSGLYGVLRPLDLIQPYRLEMGTRLQTKQGNNLYQFWGDQITELFNQEGSPLLINLASNEYYKAIQPAILSAKVLTLSFKENKAGIYKTIAIYAKRARGLMTHFIIKNRLIKAEQIKQFNDENYQFNERLSSPTEWVFSR